MELHKMPNKLFAKKLLGTTDHLEEQEFKRLISDQHMAAEYELTRKLWDEAEHAKVFDQIDTDADWNTVCNSINRFPVNYKKIPWSSYFIRIAALLVLTTGLSTAVYKLLITKQDTSNGFTSYSADLQKRTVSLPDGSAVSLNVGSDISFREGFGTSSRDLILNGEAYFNVIPGMKLPFRVFSGQSVVEVTGTSFSVYQVDGTVHVSVLTGKVVLSSTDSLTRSISITANQSGYLSGRNEMILEEGIPDNVLSWKTGRLIFEETPIDSALMDIAHHFRKELSINEDFEEKITAEFQDQPLHEILDEITLVAGLRFDTSGTALIVRK